MGWNLNRFIAPQKFVVVVVPSSFPLLFSSDLPGDLSAAAAAAAAEVERESDARAACKNPKGHSFLSDFFFIAHLLPRHRARRV